MQFQKLTLFFGFALFVCLNPVIAKCVLPVPDDGDVLHNPANLEGEIVQVSGVSLLIKKAKSDVITLVQLNEKLPIYTAFGGDGRISELKTGLHVWVWYKNCLPIKNEQGAIPKAAYFQVYSFDPNDRPYPLTPD